MIKIIVCENYDEMSKRAYRIMKEVLLKPNPVLGLATGSSPIGLYQEMIKDHKENNVSYKDVITFNLDEYANLDINHPESYYSFMHKNLFSQVDIDSNNINIPKGTGDLEANCKEYDQRMKDYKLSIQVLGVGSNGHIGFNEPNTPFTITTHVVKLDESTRKDNSIYFDSLDQVPTHACTMGIANIMDAEKIILLASGKKKAKAISGMVNGEIVESLPASILQRHPDVTVIIDKEAASEL